MIRREGALFTLSVLALSPLILPREALSASMTHAYLAQPELAQQFTKLHMARTEGLRGTQQEHIITMSSLKHLKIALGGRRAQSSAMVDVFTHLAALSRRPNISIRFIQEVPASTTTADMRFMQYPQNDDGPELAAYTHEPTREILHGVGTTEVDELWKEYVHVQGAADPAHASPYTFQVMGMFALGEG